MQSGEKIVALQQQRIDKLCNLLAIIHRDGGHYISEHGIDKAIDDAHLKWAKLIVLKDAMEEEFKAQPITYRESRLQAALKEVQ